MNRISIFCISPLFFISQAIHSQNIEVSYYNGINVHACIFKKGTVYKLSGAYPLFTFRVNNDLYTSAHAISDKTDSVIFFNFMNDITGEITEDKNFNEGWKCRVIIRNQSPDTLDIENLVPFGESPNHVYLTSTGPWALARAKLFRPGLCPVGVILPDNAWELGYASVPLDSNYSVCALARRTQTVNAESRRYRTIVNPGGSVEYTIWADEYTGEWQNGLKKMFHDHYLFDLEGFEDTLYRRPDLRWIRHAYLIGLQFAWNREFYDWQSQQYTVNTFLEKGKSLFGGYDVIGLWPTWPRLGVDERNQWDLFEDLPGGLEQIRKFSQEWKQQGTRFFICYNPWDESTRSENPYSGMAKLIEETEADGVVLDCHGASSRLLQHAADSVRAGVIMYSEGMAVVKDMPGIVAGRVHDAIVLPPPLNLNKLIRPDFAIFRVCQIHDGRIRRETSIAFFNGYGTELNSFAPGQPENMEDDLVYLGKTTRLLRENTSCFLSDKWTPLLPATTDSIWVNKWPDQTKNKTIFTVFSLKPEGFSGPLFESDRSPGMHLVSLWHHEELDWTENDGKTYIPVKVDAFNSFDLGTRDEGNIDCIAQLPVVTSADLKEGILTLDADRGDEIRIWAGMPSYRNEKVRIYSIGSQRINVPEIFGNYEGKIVVQVFEDNELLDERVLRLEAGTPRLLAMQKDSTITGTSHKGMVKIPGGLFSFRAENTDQFIPYPGTKDPVIVKMPSYYIDKHPVTNSEYYDFIQASGYRTADTVNYLRHWNQGKVPPGLEKHPVVYISLEDAKAYASWAGKRLPSEMEWQYAAQGPEGLTWPWGNEFDSTRCNNRSGRTTAVDAFPAGASRSGVIDLVGNVWQLTGDVYNNGTYYFVIMKGGSFYMPTASWWYVKGGPQPNTWHQQLLLVSPGFDRNSTVGFRCVKDDGK